MINLVAVGLSSCFILLGSSLLYANSGTTNLDGLYVIASLSDLASLSNPAMGNVSSSSSCEPAAGDFLGGAHYLAGGRIGRKEFFFVPPLSENSV